MICQECGTKAKERAKFCGACGTPLVLQAVAGNKMRKLENTPADADASATRLPDVIPTDQIDAQGNVKKVRPLTYALLTFVKVVLGMEDTVNISDDENEGEWQFEFNSNDENYNFTLYINTHEAIGLITLDIYLNSPSGVIEGNDINRMEELLRSVNLHLRTGQFQLIDGINGNVRFHSSIDVTGIASEDPNYSGPHLIQPKLIQNIFEYGKSAMTKFVDEHPELTSTISDEAANNEGSLDDERDSEFDYSRAVKKGNELCDAGSSKAKAAEVIFEMLPNATRNVLLKAFQEGAGLTPAGASSYLQKIRAKLK